MAKRVWKDRRFEGIVPSAGRAKMSMKWLDLEFEEIFLPVDEKEACDIDEKGNLKFENFISDELLNEQGIPLTASELLEILKPKKKAA